MIWDGAALMEGRELKTLDEGEIYKEVAERVPRVLGKTGLKEEVRPRWPVI